ncbi:hypothetical protein [Geodermatophilus sp. URMC 65]
MQLYLTRVATSLGYTATPEHPPTRADVFVHECSYCLEVQLRPTQFRQRTSQREAKGARVCWFIREGLNTEKARKALFGLPAVRFRVVDGSEPGQLITPWDEPDNQDLLDQARLQVFGTIAHLERSRTGELAFRTRTMDGTVFLDEILSDRRRWYRPMILGRRTGLWALRGDVSAYFARRRRHATQP